MGRRIAVLETNDIEGLPYYIIYAKEKHNDLQKEAYSDVNKACDELIKSLTIYSYKSDRINLYAPNKYHGTIEISIAKYKDRIKALNLDIRLR